MNKQAKKGFTIIEVVLVLAIAGLIFLMVFIALPALQRSQRNTRRRQDMARILSALNDYQANNNGQMPCQTPFDGNECSKEDGQLTKFVERYVVGEKPTTSIKKRCGSCPRCKRKLLRILLRSRRYHLCYDCLYLE